MTRTPILALSLITFCLQNPAQAATRLTIQDYLEQVSGESPAARAQKLRSQSGLFRSEGSEVLTFPYLFGSATNSVDKSETAFPNLQGTESQSTVYSIGVGINSAIGLNGKYTWNTTDALTTGSAFATPSRYTSYNRLDLSLNLFRNGFGSEVRAKKELIRAGNTANGLSNNFAYAAKIAEAEAAYWRLSLARQAVTVQKDVLERAGRLLSWAKRRVSLQLGDRSDLLQAQAQHDLYTIALANAVEEERNSARAFNLLRNSDGDSVAEAVGFPSVDETLKMPAPVRTGDRLDLQAAEARSLAAKAQSQLDKEALKPTVDLSATYAWNGRDPARSEAISEAFGSRHPTRAIGISFSVPLNVPTLIRAGRGSDMEIEAAELEVQQARLSEGKDWNELEARLKQARSRLSLVNTLERVQKEKSENERARLQRGRTTTFQALTFEQDYAQSQLNRLRTQAEVLQLLAQMRTYTAKNLASADGASR